MQKFCSGCNQTKGLGEFYKKPRHTEYPDQLSGYSYNCKECDKLARAQYVKDNPDKAKNSDRAYRLNKYGISVQDYNNLFAAQNGCCGGCGRHQSEFNKRLAVDHCHASGKVRGLLCMPCNLALGYTKDNVDVLANLIKYLSKSELAADTNIVRLRSPKKAG